MRLHFTDGKRTLNIDTATETYNQTDTNNSAVTVSESGYEELLSILSFNCFDYSEDLEPEPFY